MSGPCLCGDTACPACGAAQGTLERDREVEGPLAPCPDCGGTGDRALRSLRLEYVHCPRCDGTGEVPATDGDGPRPPARRSLRAKGTGFHWEAERFPYVLHWTCGHCGFANEYDLEDPGLHEPVDGENKLTAECGADADGGCMAETTFTLHVEVRATLTLR